MEKRGETTGKIVFKKSCNENSLKLDSCDTYPKEKVKLCRPTLGKINEESSSNIILPTPQPMKYIYGPDQILPCKVYATSDPHEAVKLRVEERGTGNASPVSIPTMFERALTRHADKVAMSFKKHESWVHWTYKQLYKSVRTCAKAFVKLGLEQHSSVCLIGEYTPEWAVAHLATIFAGGVSVSTDRVPSIEDCKNKLQACDIRIIVVKDITLLDNALSMKKSLEGVRGIVVSSGMVKMEDVYSWSQLMHLGGREPDEPLDRRMKNIAINHACVITFPNKENCLKKGIMFSHDNITFTVLQLILYAKPLDGREVIIAQFLPCHILGQVADLFFPLSIGGHVYFSSTKHDEKSILKDIEEIRPTLLFASSSTWEMISNRILEIQNKIGGYKKLILNWARNVAIQFNEARIQGGSSSTTQMDIGYHLIIKKILKVIGLDRCRLQLTGGKALTKTVFDHLLSMNILVLSAYGMAECLLVTISTDKNCREGSVGRVRSGTEISIVETGDVNEVRVKSRSVFMGYIGDEKLTEASLDEDGWFYTGDEGMIDQSKFLFIKGKKTKKLNTPELSEIGKVEACFERQFSLASRCTIICTADKEGSIYIQLKSETTPLEEEYGEELVMINSEFKDYSVNYLSQNYFPVHSEFRVNVERCLCKVNEENKLLKIHEWHVLNGNLFSLYKTRDSFINAVSKIQSENMETNDATQEIEAPKC